MDVSELILHLVKHEDDVEILLKALHKTAKHYDLEFGLPINDYGSSAMMHMELLQWLANYTDRVDVYGPTQFKDDEP